MWKYTTIVHAVRAELEITCFEYCILDYVYHRSTYPKAPVAGWCTDTRQAIADALGISKRWVIKSITKLNEAGLLEISEQAAVRTSERWYTLAYGEPEEGEQSAPGGVNKVHREGERSAPSSINDNNKINKNEDEIERLPHINRANGFEPPTVEDVAKYYQQQYEMNPGRFYNAGREDLESIAFAYVNARERIDWRTTTGVPLYKWKPDALNFGVSFGRNMNRGRTEPGALVPEPSGRPIQARRWVTFECKCGSRFTIDANEALKNPSAQYQCTGSQSDRCTVKQYSGQYLTRLIEKTESDFIEIG
jgi:hypothetical protein